MSDIAPFVSTDANAFGPLIASTPNPTANLQDAIKFKLGMQAAALQQAQVQQTMAVQRAMLARQQQYTQNVQDFFQHPTTQGLGTLWAYPEFQESSKGIFDAMDPKMRQQKATQLGSVVSVLQNAQGKDGTYDPKMLDNAAQIIQEQIDADKAAGNDPSDDERVLGMIQSGDPKQIAAVKAMTASAIAGAAGFDKAKDFLTTIGLDQSPVMTEPGKTATNPLTGATVVSQPANLTPQTLNVPGGGQELVGFNPNPGAGGGSVGTGTTQTGGGDPASGAAGAQAAVGTVLHNEGGLNPSDMNGYPTNFGINYKANKAELAAVGIKSPAQMGNLTREQAAQIYATKYWPQSGAASLPANLQTPYFDVYVRNPSLAKKALAQSGGDPQKFMAIASGYFQNMAANNPKAAKYQKAWANRDANNLAIATGAAPQAGAQAGAPAPVGTPPPGGAVVLANTGNTGALNTEGAQPGYAWNKDHTTQIPVPGATADFTPEALGDATDQYILTGQLPGGMGGGAIKSAIMKNIPARLAGLGLQSSDLPALRSRYKGLSSSLTQNTQILNMLEASENALHANAQQVLATQQKLVKDGILSNTSPSVNNGWMELYSHTGSAQTKADIKAYEDAVNGLTQEYTKFMNSANGMGGNAAPSDAARGLAGDLNDPGQGPATMQRHIQQIFIETGNKRNGIGAQNAKIQAQISSLLRPHGDLPAGAKIIGTYKGHRVIEVNGQRLVEQ